MALALAASAFPTAAHATPDPSPDEAGAPEEFVFGGRGVYAGGGVGVLPEAGEGAGSFRVRAVFPVHPLLAFEIGSFGYRFAVADHHGEEVVSDALGIDTGLRVAAPPWWVVRPYAAGRFQHLHFFPDPWGEHDPSEGDGSDAHASHHRWAAAAAAGVEAGLFGPTSRWRAGLEGEVAAVTGPGVDTALQLVALLGVGF